MKVALMHGFMGDPSDWDEVLPALEAKWPESQFIVPQIQPAQDWQTGLAELVNEIPAGTVLIGYSMGARLSLGMTLSSQERFRGLLFCSGNPGIEQADQRTARRESDRRIADQIAIEERRHFLERWYQSPVFRSLTPQVRQQEIERKLARSGDDWSSILRCYSVAEQPNYWPLLSSIRIPCIAIAGQHDRKYAHMLERMSSLPNIETRLVSECGHIVHHEQPQVFLTLVDEFLSRVSAVGSSLG